MTTIVLALLIGLAAVAVSVRRLMRLAEPAGAHPEAVRRSLGVPDPKRARAVAVELPPSEARELVLAMLDAPSRSHAIAELNEQMSRVAGRLQIGAEVPRVAARVSMASGTVLAIVELARTLPSGAHMTAPLAAFAIGLTAGIVCLEVGRRASLRLRRQAAGWNALGRALARLWPAEDP